MVNRYSFFFFFCLFAVSAAAQEVSVSIALDEQKVGENVPITGTVIVTHSEAESIETLQMPEEDLHVEQIDEVKREKGIVDTQFSWNIPSKKQGLYLLPPIQAVVGKKTYESKRLTVQVIPRRIHLSADGVLFYLEAEWEGQKPLYPGERGTMIYRIFFNHPIELTEEILPLLNPQGFVKIGEVEVRETEKGGVAVQEIRQQVEAKIPGSYSYGPSQLQGKVSGRGNIVNAEAPPVNLAIQPFPSEGKPPSFNGAIGKFSWEIAREKEGPVDIGSPISFLVSFSGEGNFSELQVPDFLCQPGFSGLFTIDPPKVDTLTDTKKVFQLTLRPLASFLGNIPPMEFSFFDRESQEYVRLRQGPFPLQVKPVAVPTTEREERGDLVWDPVPLKTEIAWEPFPEPRGERPFSSMQWIFVLFPMGALLLVVQQVAQRKWQRRVELQRSLSRAAFLEAKKHLHSSGEFYTQMEKALRLRAVEKQVAPSVDTPISLWKTSSFSKEVQQWLKEEEVKRYSFHGQKQRDEDLLKEWKRWEKEWC